VQTLWNKNVPKHETTFILIQLFHNLRKNLTLTLSEISAFLGTAKVENFATLAFSFADSDPTTALHNDISYPSHLESQ